MYSYICISGRQLRSGTLGPEQLRRLISHPSFSTDVQLKNPDLFPEISSQGTSNTRNPIRFPNPLDEDQLLLSVEPFPEESLANKRVQTNTKSFGFMSTSSANSPLFGQSLPRNRNNFNSPLSSTPQDSPLIRVTAKPIKNPFLQALFNRQSIQVAKEQIVRNKQQPRISPQRQKSLDHTGSFPSFQRESHKTVQTSLPELNQSIESQQEDERRQKQNSPSKAKSLREKILQQKKAQNEEISKILETTQKDLLKEKDLEEKQKELEALLKEKKEKERLLMEALIEQKAIQEQARRENEQKERISKERQKIVDEKAKKAAMKKESKRIADENRRNRFEEREKERKRLSEEETSITQSIEQQDAFRNAIDAVRKRTDEGTDKFSPAVWIAVKVLTEFMERQDKENTPEIPPTILMAIIQLTQFLNKGKDQALNSQEKKNDEPALSPLQVKLRDQILRQKEQQAEEIANILNAEAIESFMEAEEKTNTPASIQKEKTSPNPTFPARILIPAAIQEGQASGLQSEFTFDTLPVL